MVCPCSLAHQTMAFRCPHQRRSACHLVVFCAMTLAKLRSAHHGHQLFERLRPFHVNSASELSSKQLALVNSSLLEARREAGAKEVMRMMENCSSTPARRESEMEVGLQSAGEEIHAEDWSPVFSMIGLANFDWRIQGMWLCQTEKANATNSCDYLLFQIRNIFGVKHVS